jgi:uncharacterized protein (TIGR00730 family)
MSNKDNIKHDIVQIPKDLQKGYDALKNIDKSITIFGSARVKEDDKYYKDAYMLAKLVAKNGFNIITGGGGGIMSAANKGAFEISNILSIGLNIKLPKEQALNPYTNLDVEFEHFYSRKYMLVHFSQAIVVFPGGFGTLDELFETIVLIQTKKIKKIKIFLYSKEFWSNIIKTIESRLLDENYISIEDLDIVDISDDIAYISQNIV